jgi:hypothetical protein
MKKFFTGRKMFSLSLFLCLVLGFLACHTEPDKKTAGTAGDVRFYQKEISVPLWSKDEAVTVVPAGAGDPSLHIILSLAEVSVKPEGTREDLKALFRNLFYEGMEAGDYAEKQILLKTAEYHDFKETIRSQPDLFFSETLNWYYEEKFEMEMDGPRFLVLSRNWAEYTGGAHGNYGKNYFVFDREKARRISLADIAGENQRMLTEKLNRELRKSRELEGSSLEEYGFFVSHVEPAENFFLSPEGIGFHWDPYEIGPYSMGFVEVIVPYGDIESILSPLGRMAAREAGGE